jgi:hypothetical protein
MNYKQLICISASVILLQSCWNKNHSNSLENPSPYFKNFMPGNEDAVLRNIGFNVSPEEIKKMETSKLYEETPDHLFYEYSFPTDSTPFSEYANIQYFFNEENQLDIITADIYMSDSLQENKLRNNLTDYFNHRYGSASKEDNGEEVWNGKYKDKNTNSTYKYTVDIKDLEDNDYGVSIEYVRE